MAAPNTWHPGTGRLISRWPVPIPLQPDELFSTWLTRAALAQGCDPLVLAGELWPKWRAWTCDLDRGLSEERLSILANVSGIDAASLEAACMRPIVSAIASESFLDPAVWPWVLAFGSRNRKHHGGLQYCPVCLKEDRKPFYRVQWRLAWHTCCPMHSISLLDRCPYCGVPIEPHRLLPVDNGMALCSTCKRDLCETTTIKVNADALAYQQAADCVATHGNGRYGIHVLSSKEWFALSRYFLMLLRKVALQKSDRLSAFVTMLDVDVNAMTSPATGLAFELLPVQERVMLLASAWRILSAGTDRFLEATKTEALTASSLRDGHLSIPLCIDSMIQSLPDKTHARKQNEQNSILKPRSHQAVMHMWARLKRKMLVAAR